MKKILNFIGNGSCFNTKAGNTSAYFIHVIKQKSRLVLFDCGEVIFDKILQNDLLKDIDEVFIWISHLHSDHVGSLPSLIFYLHYVLNIKPVVCFPCDDINVYLNMVGVKRELYEYVSEKNNYYDMTVFKHNHGFNLNSFGCLFKVGDILIYYSGDSKTIDEKVIRIFRGEDPDYINTPITEFCQDATKYINDAHMNIHDLANIFSKEERKRVTLMHFDDDKTIKIAKKYGFNIAKM